MEIVFIQTLREIVLNENFSFYTNKTIEVGDLVYVWNNKYFGQKIVYGSAQIIVSHGNGNYVAQRIK